MDNKNRKGDVPHMENPPAPPMQTVSCGDTVEKKKRRETCFVEMSIDNVSTEILDKLSNQPISRVTWAHRDELNANLYNPNVMAPPEMKLLVESITKDGWLFPICVLEKDVHIEGLTDNANHDRYTIIDGFHRYKTSANPVVYALTDGYVPLVFPMGDDHIATTIRMNRVKGTHTVLAMSDIIKILQSQGRTVEYIMKEYGMEREEVTRLAASAGIPKSDIITEANFSKAWIPSK